MSRGGERPDAPIGPVVVATGNAGKVEDFRLLFRGTGIELQMPSDHGLSLDVEETGVTFRENALLKARAHFEKLGVACLADDSGLAVNALDGRPGVYSARYAGEPGDDAANNRKVLTEMRGKEDRRAAFVCVLALVLPSGEEILTEGRCEGTLTTEPRGENGFGYDSLFYREDLGRTFGEVSPKEKNARSHRAAATRLMVDELRRRGLAG